MTPRAPHRWLLCLALALLFSGCGPNTQMPQTPSDAERSLEQKKLSQGHALTGSVAKAVTPAKATPKAAAKPKAASPQPVETADAAPTRDPNDVVLGVFELDREDKKGAILDGDTIRVKGLDSTLRLIGIDTEETFKNDKDRAASRSGFKAYAEAKRGDKKFPAKFATPMGEEAGRWAKEWFKGTTNVRLEYDDVSRKRGVFNRHLVHVFAKKDGVWVNYNIESVRAGMTPYFMKYGYSSRFHEELLAAQKEARDAKRGIWGGKIEGYTDYDERLEWWTRRAEALRNFQQTHGGSADVVQLGMAGAHERLTAMLGQPVTVFSSLDRKSRLDKGAPFIRFLSHTKKHNFALVSQTLAGLDALNLDQYQGEYFYVRGTLSAYKGSPQFQVTAIEKVWTE